MYLIVLVVGSNILLKITKSVFAVGGDFTWGMLFIKLIVFVVIKAS
jgi:hypothetical protein